jgi:uncharacterized membrane protein
LTKDILDPRKHRESPNAAFLTWNLSLEVINKYQLRAADILSLMAVFDHQGISEVLIVEGHNSLDMEDVEALGTLQAFSLISTDDESKNYIMHGLVQQIYSHKALAKGHKKNTRKGGLETGV